MSRTIYFGYGSNLWLRQMQLRCPDSKYLGLGRLRGWRLQINQRGYCNVVQKQEQQLNSSSETSRHSSNKSNDEYVWEVYGVVYSLSGGDEAKLDINEGVPQAYTKEIINLDFWPADHESTAVNVLSTPLQKDMLVYVNRMKTIDSLPQTEYIFRMNRGMEDGLRLGLPQEYVDSVMRKFISKDGDKPLDKEEREKAEQQAREFKDSE